MSKSGSNIYMYNKLKNYKYMTTTTTINISYVRDFDSLKTNSKKSEL